MKHQETRFSCVYEDLKRRIVSGQFRLGSKLPSFRDLYGEYNVGVATITRALDALETEGLVDIQIRRAPVVLSQDLQIPGIPTILEQRNYILRVCETYELLLPYLLVFATRNCSIEVMPRYRQAQKAARSGVSVESQKVLIALAQDILGANRNPLLYDLHMVFELQGDFAYFLEKGICSRGSIRSRPAFEPKSIIAILQEQNPVGQFHHLKALYGDMYDVISKVFDQMSGNVPTVPAQISSIFEWNPLRGKNYYYTRIVHDLTRKIETGIYTTGSYLPYEAQLTEQYGVPAYTVRRALGLLERRGYTKTLNGKGAVVLTPGQLNTEQALLDFTMKQEILTYLHSLQLVALLSYPVAAYTAPRLSAGDSNQLAAHIKKPEIFLTDLSWMILERLSLEPLNAIWIETGRITKWEFYLVFYPQGIGVTEQLNEVTRSTHQCLYKGNHEALTRDLADSYRLTLSSIQAYMVEKYKFTEALSVRVP